MGKRSKRASDDRSEPRPTLFVIRPHQQESREVRDLAEAVANRATSLGCIVKTRRSLEDRVSGAEERERPLWLLSPRDANEIYTAAHRSRVSVATFRAAYVRRDPSTTPARRRDLIGLEPFVRYKAFFGLIRGVTDIETFFRNRDTWNARSECDGIADPRVLPFHVFDTAEDASGLDHPDRRAAFEERYRRKAGRIDTSDRTWARADSHAFHGGPALQIRNVTLPQGFHWDVSSDNTRLCTAHEVWRLDAEGAYANVYPDGFVRAARGKARLVWPQ